MFSKIWFVLTARCEDATRTFSDECETPTKGHRWWAARLHLLGCAPCRQNRRRFLFLERVFALAPPEIRKQFDRESGERLMSDESANRLRRALEEAREEEIDDIGH